MRRISTLLTLFFLIGLLAGCGISLEKRRHTGGYYVNVNPRKHAAKQDRPAVQEPESEAVAAIRTEAVSAPAEESEQLVAEAVAPVNETEAPAAEAAMPVRAAYADAPSGPATTIRHTSDQPSVFRQVAERVPVKALKVKNVKSGSGATSADALSLFWIVILVLLVLWAAGLISGGWGLGWVINVLLVIALVLLILWLLRIV